MAKDMNLVIVESPAKAKTIGKYLGSNYMVTASMGHLRDLPKSKLGVDIDHGFAPDYQPVKAREATIKELRSVAKKASKVYLATDPDREGEAISWHLKELLKLPDDKAFRVTFNEITKNVVKQSIENPRPIDMGLVDAQQARRILDRIVGYKLSPLLWKKIKRGLSAGRVQSVASRMVVDKENDIRAFVPEEYWLVNAILSPEKSDETFSAAYHGTTSKKAELTTAEDVEAVIEAVTNDQFRVHSIKRTDKKRSASPPFITSSLQQEASRKLGMTPRQTMMIAQQLYEGIDIKGAGTVGLITYMRTDSLRISDDAARDAKAYILDNYGKEYYPQSQNRYKTKGSAQDAHEAIRPSDVFMNPESIKNSLKKDQLRLYKLIWSRFVASQMTAAIFDSLTVDVTSGGHVFRANHTVLSFPGHTAAYESSGDEKIEKSSALVKLLEEQLLDLKEITKEQKFTLPPARYTEATLIRAMEESGVGRPSTYAPTISTILDREYVVKEGKSLRPTVLGEVVVGMMKERFADIVDLQFTAHMEEHLDEVENGKDNWQNLLAEFYGKFNETLEKAEKDLEGERIHIPPEYSEEVCDLCGKQMVYKSGRFGRFLACPGYPECTFTKPIVVEMPGKCPKCGSRILKRTSKRGYAYYACENSKDCGFMTWDVPVADNCPECGKTMFKLSGRGAKKPFCINEKCTNFLPEDNRGYRKKKEKTEGEQAQVDGENISGEGEPSFDKKDAAASVAGTTKKKTSRTTKKTAAKKTATAKKTTTKRTTRKTTKKSGES